MNLVFETNFTILPAHTNYHIPMVFGGHFFSEMDICAAQCVSRLLYDSPCESAVTHKANVDFMKPCYVGDLVFLKATVEETRHKSVRVKVVADREKRGKPERDRVAEATFIFVTIAHTNDVSSCPDLLPYAAHQLTLTDADRS